MHTRSLELLESGAPQVTAREEAAVAVPDKAAPMVPTAALVDADGRVTARVDAAACRNPSPSPTVETVPWQAWYSGVQEQRLVARARTTLHVAMGSLMESLDCPIAIIKKDGNIPLVLARRWSISSLAAC